jgi:hypothetical protein
VPHRVDLVSERLELRAEESFSSTAWDGRKRRLERQRGIRKFRFPFASPR